MSVTNIFNSNILRNKYCPFQSINITESGQTIEIEGNLCIGEQCQLWVKNTDKQDDIFKSIRGNIDPTAISKNSDDGRCGMQVSDMNENIFRLLHHMHMSHSHNLPHNTSMESPYGSNSFKPLTPSSAGILINEFMSKEDLDGNSKIYGIDFIIINDSTRPSILNNVTKELTRTVKNYVSWNNFIDQVFPPYISSIVPNVGNIDGGTRIKITGSFFSGDVNDFSILFGEDEGTNIYIKDSNTLYVTSPFTDSSGYTPITISNSGDTFNTGKNTGGSSVYSNIFSYTEDDDDEDIQTDIKEEEGNVGLIYCDTSVEAESGNIYTGFVIINDINTTVSAYGDVS